MPQVFISHASSDRAFVEDQLAPLLRLHGISPWYSTQDIPSASHWEGAIRQGLNSSEWFLVVLTAAAVSSEWVHAELHWAFENRPNRIVPVLAGDCSPSDLSLRLLTLQYVDFRHDTEGARERLLAVWERALRDAAALELHLLIRPVGRPESTELAGEALTVIITEMARIGRDAKADIHLSSPSVSRNHAVLKVRKHEGTKSLWLYDLSSATALSLNDVRVEKPSILAPGDRITVGDMLIVIRGIRSVGDAS